MSTETNIFHSGVIGESRTFIRPIINWSWYLDCTFNADGTITVNHYYRLHQYDHTDHPSYVAGVNVIMNEDSERNLRSVTFENSKGRQTFEVRNKKHIFQFPEHELEKQPRNW